MRPALVTLVTAAAIAVSAAPAQAQTWTGEDRRADVRAQPYRPAGDPCQQPPEHRVRHDKRHDITSLTVDHGSDAVVLTLAVREVARRDAATTYDVHVRTPDDAFSIDLARYEPGGDLQTFLAEEPDPPSPAEVGDDCSYAYSSVGLPCEGLTALADVKTDLVTVTIPRTCLDDPAWVKAAAQVYGFTKTDAQGRFTVFRDVWAPPGVRPTGFLPPFGPRVKQG